VIATQAAEDACATLCCWLNDDIARGQFVDRLRGIFAEAIGIWQHLQRTRQGAVAVMDLAPDGWIEETDARSEYNSISLESKQNSQQQPSSELVGPLAILFPQVWVGDEVLFHGFALFPTQTAVIAASLERNSQRSLRKTTGHRRRTSDMDRRSRIEQEIASRVPHNASGGVMPQRRPSLPATPAQSDLSFPGRLGNSRPTQVRADPVASVSSKGRRSERGSSGD
jgi:hypothetical protein